MPHTVFKLAVFGIFLVSCSTSGIAPDVANFGDTVVKIAGRDARSPDAKTLPARVATARRADFAAANVQYQASDRDACEYNRPDLDTARFSDACRLVPVILLNDRLATAASEYDPEPIQNAAEVVVKAGNTALLQELLAGDIREALVEYAKELETLATTKDPSEIGTAAGKAFDAVTTLKDTTTAASTRTGKPPPPSATRKPRRNLITRAATEAAELLRYRALTEVVRSADPFVSAAAVQMAALTFRGEAPELERKASALRDAMLASDAGTEAGLARIEQAYDDLAASDSKSAFRGYSEIGATHSKILRALELPGDLERLADANKSIEALALTFKSVASGL